MLDSSCVNSVVVCVRVPGGAWLVRCAEGDRITCGPSWAFRCKREGAAPRGQQAEVGTVPANHIVRTDWPGATAQASSKWPKCIRNNSGVGGLCIMKASQERQPLLSCSHDGVPA